MMRCVKDKRKYPLPDGGESEERAPETWEEACDVLDEFEERDKRIRLFKESIGRGGNNWVQAAGGGKKGTKKGRGRGKGHGRGGAQGGRLPAFRFKAKYGDCRHEHDGSCPYDHSEASLRAWRESHPDEVRLGAHVAKGTPKGGKKGKSKGKAKQGK